MTLGDRPAPAQPSPIKGLFKSKLAPSPSPIENPSHHPFRNSKAVPACCPAKPRSLPHTKGVVATAKTPQGPESGSSVSDSSPFPSPVLRPNKPADASACVGDFLAFLLIVMRPQDY